MSIWDSLAFALGVKAVQASPTSAGVFGMQRIIVCSAPSMDSR